MTIVRNKRLCWSLTTARSLSSSRQAPRLACIAFSGRSAGASSGNQRRSKSERQFRAATSLKRLNEEAWSRWNRAPGRWKKKQTDSRGTFHRWGHFPSLVLRRPRVSRGEKKNGRRSSVGSSGDPVTLPQPGLSPSAGDAEVTSLENGCSSSWSRRALGMLRIRPARRVGTEWSRQGPRVYGPSLFALPPVAPLSFGLPPSLFRCRWSSRTPSLSRRPALLALPCPRSRSLSLAPS